MKIFIEGSRKMVELSASRPTNPLNLLFAGILNVQNIRLSAFAIYACLADDVL